MIESNGGIVMEMLTLLKQIIGHDDFEITYENQNKAYHGMFCYHGDQTYRVRSGKFTPKKKGAFVVMWEKDGNNKNKPYDFLEFPQYLVVIISRQNKSGYFLFPKEELKKRRIISDGVIVGKMGFRVYLPDETGLNQTALRTQGWQAEYYHSLF